MAEVTCKTHPDAPHGFDRNASHNADRYVCECEGWQPADNAGAVWEGETMVHPPPKQWVGLTEPELHQINPTWPAPGQQWDYEDVLAFVRAIEQASKEKNT
jgi:hypothetical protein